MRGTGSGSTRTRSFLLVRPLAKRKRRSIACPSPGEETTANGSRKTRVRRARATRTSLGRKQGARARQRFVNFRRIGPAALG